MEQIQNAIEIAWNPVSEPNLKSQALEFLNRLRSDPQGWQICLSLATRNPQASEVVRHVALEVVNNAIQAREVDLQGLQYMKDTLLGHVKTAYGPEAGDFKKDSTTIQNKITQTITYLFCALYTTQWTTFFSDILALTSLPGSAIPDNAPAIKLFLGILISVHDEIADVLVPRSPDEHKRDTDLKDLVRQRDARRISQFWEAILLQWRGRNTIIANQCLSSIARWASWTDLTLIVNDTLLTVLFEFINPPLQPSIDQDGLRDVALNTFIEITEKKMKPDDKLELIQILRIRDVISQVIASPAVHDLRSTSNYDTDLAELIAKLVNNTALDVINILASTGIANATLARANDQLKIFMPYVLRFFSDEYDEICSTVIPSLTDLLTYLRKHRERQAEYASMLSPLLQAIIAKMKYDETSAWGTEDAQTDEAEFQELRKRLQILQQAVAAVDERLYIDTIDNVVGTIFERYRERKGQVDWRDLDLAMHEMFLFGELAVKNGGLYSKTKPVSPAAERLIGMMFKLLDTGRVLLALIVSFELTFNRCSIIFTPCNSVAIHGTLRSIQYVLRGESSTHHWDS